MSNKFQSLWALNSFLNLILNSNNFKVCMNAFQTEYHMFCEEYPANADVFLAVTWFPVSEE